MAQDNLIRAKEKYRDAKEAFRETRVKMVEDLRFSNPANPEQWDADVRKSRENRPCLTFDQTNQYVAQVVNDSRQNKPAIHCLPSDANGAIKVAQALEGIIRNVEYASRASIAYDTAQEYAARIGLGWIRVVTEITDHENNYQEPRIMRVHDPLSVLLDCDSVEPDGSDATDAFVETVMTKRAFEKAHPKKATTSWDNDGWFTDDSVKVCEHFYIEENEQNRIMVRQEDGSMFTVTEDEYWQLAARTGMKPPIGGTFKAKQRKVMWQKMTGAEIMDSREFASQYIPVVPVLGYELWVEGKRSLCGMVRRMRDSQQAYNYERTAQIERIALEPKAPFIAPIEAIEGFENEWKAANTSNQAYLPYNQFGEDGVTPLQRPQREGAPQMSQAFAQAGQQAINDLQASIGMYKSNLGAPSNAMSGRAKIADQREGDTANFHYIDNLSRSIEQVGRIVVDMIPRLMDTKRVARILNMDGTNDTVIIDPNQEQPYAKQDGQISINLSSGKYDVRVKAGPAYSTLRQEASDNLTKIVQSNPAMMSILGPMWAKMQDWPEAEKVSRMLMAVAPPEVRAAAEDQDQEMPQQAKAQIDQANKQVEELGQALEDAMKQLETAKNDKAVQEAEIRIKQQEADTRQFDAETKRIQAVNTPLPPDPTAPDVTQIEVAQINANKEVKVAYINATAKDAKELGEEPPEFTEDETGEIVEKPTQTQLLLQAMVETNQQLIQVMAAPRTRQLVRDANGQADYTVETIQGAQ